MAARKLNQEIEKCFKKVNEGVAEFESIYDKIEQSNNPTQKDKLEDNLKREIKKLQRLRDQIKTWAASNDIKDKGPLLEHRRLIETQMEKFKAVEKAMKTKAYSKEGLSAAAKLDPKEQAKAEACEFLANTVDELELQIERLEAETESIQATLKKGKGPSAKLERIAEIESIIERHKWHQGKLELIRRCLENGGVDSEQVKELEEEISYYVAEGDKVDCVYDEEMYDALNLEEDEDVFGMNLDNDKGSSQDAHSIQDDAAEAESRNGPTAPASRSTPTPATASSGKHRTVPAETAAAVAPGRRPSAQLKSPLPTLATVNTNTLPTIGSGSSSTMKPAPIPPRPAGEGLKYASAAAAAAANDKNNLGISPLPPPSTPGAGISPLPTTQAKASMTNSPSLPIVQPVAQEKPPAPAPSTAPAASSSLPSVSGKAETARAGGSRGKAPTQTTALEPPSSTTKAQINGVSNGIKPITEEEEEESIYHLPESLRDLVEAFEGNKNRPAPMTAPATQRMQGLSEASKPQMLDGEMARHYHPDVKFHSHAQFPLEPLAIFDDPRLYTRIDPDTLFYVFYYKQKTYQQYLAAKALKDQSWRFHKQYQTWFQRHEEPKNITEEFEQGTYRFFDYESTWMNRRKADFKFAYKFLEDDV
ncbi:general negative regulator of transcription subunit 3 [Rhypophila decipiens]|uniref:General negative regulator of transcription subunit n=1 Tax=Rhypophila decipiens TaxID=261697 RepID=A0AAN6Y4E2_9PEZI|nr:general negative regulator of transcription subunit 3 [Rhypophila decipiens]